MLHSETVAAQVPGLCKTFEAVGFALSKDSHAGAVRLDGQVWILRRRYAYLGGVDAGGKGFKNPFDRGLAPNVRQFWGEGQPDWAQEYHIGMQVNKVLAMSLILSTCMTRHCLPHFRLGAASHMLMVAQEGTDDQCLAARQCLVDRYDGTPLSRLMDAG